MWRAEEKAAVQTISLPYTLPPLLLNSWHGAIKPAVGNKKMCVPELGLQSNMTFLVEIIVVYV